MKSKGDNLNAVGIIEPLVSVIIPVYNCEKYLGQAIESVLSQTHPPSEVIVVDDGSTDHSARVAKGYETVRYVFKPNGGASSALNRGVELAGGNLLAFLGSDDLWVKDKLALQIAAMSSHPEFDMVFGYTQQFYSEELENSLRGRISCPAEPQPGYGAGEMLVTRAAFSKVGLFDAKWRLGEFIDWYAKAMEMGLRSLMLNEIVYRRRLHTSNLGITKRDYQMDYVRILKAALDRRRLKNGVS
jgi:glycosyltransferase involved in cell wall biosynthesis